MKTGKLFLLSTLIACFSLISVNINETSAEITKSKIERKIGSGTIDWTNKLIVVTGSGAYSETGSPAQKRLKARAAARADAYRNLAEIVNGVQVTSDTVVKNFVTESDVIKLSVSAVIRGARQIGKEKYLSDGSVEVQMALPLFGNGSVASALDLGNFVKQKTDTFESSLPLYRLANLGSFARVDNPQLANFSPREKIAAATEENKDKKTISGLIIDASFLGLEPAMNAFIIGGGKIVYPTNKIELNPDLIVKYGVTDYIDDVDVAKQDTNRIGSNPLIIEASGATGKPTKTDILLSESTVNEIKELNEKNKFLDKLGVVIVI